MYSTTIGSNLSPAEILHSQSNNSLHLNPNQQVNMQKIQEARVPGEAKGHPWQTYLRVKPFNMGQKVFYTTTRTMAGKRATMNQIELESRSFWIKTWSGQITEGIQETLHQSTMWRRLPLQDHSLQDYPSQLANNPTRSYWYRTPRPYRTPDVCRSTPDSLHSSKHISLPAAPLSLMMMKTSMHSHQHIHQLKSKQKPKVHKIVEH